MEQEFIYYAFISYSHRDEAFAKRLQHYLEHYKIPSLLCRRYPHIPKTLRPIFRDGSDLAIGQLSETLREALANSRYLIVICSENSVRPNADGKNWIDEEIRMFMDLHRETGGIKRVIPIILRQKDGPSGADCLLPAIRELDILAADVLAKGEVRAFNDVVAKMAGLKPDTLWDRQRRELRRQRRIRRLAWATTLLGAAAAGWWCWDYYTPHVTYYTDYVERRNCPEGLFELTKEQIQQRRHHYRFTTQKYHLRKVEHCNSAGTPQPHEDLWNIERPAIMELRYNEQNRVTRTMHRSAQGNRLFTRKYGPGHIDYVRVIAVGEERHEIAKPAPLATTIGQQHGAKNSISRFYVRRPRKGPNEGLIFREIFGRPHSLIPMKDAQGIGGRAYKRDALGRPIEVRYLSVISPQVIHAQAQHMETHDGIAGYRLAYGEDGQVTRVTYINLKGEPTLNEEKWAEMRIAYDERGNAVEFSHFGPDGKPSVLHNGYTRKVWQYDERGNLIRADYYGVDGKPCLHRNGYAFKTWKFDERGNLIQTDFYGADGKPCLHQSGYSRITSQYDERGNKVELAYYGTDGQRVLHKRGYSRMTERYDDDGNMLELAYYGADDELCLHKDGYARITWKHDEHGNMIEQAYFGVDGKPCLNMNNDTRVTGQYDERGNIIREANFGTEQQGELEERADEPGAPQRGHARVVCKYDDRGNRVEQAYFGVDGEPCLHRDGYSRVTGVFDESGQQKEQTYYGTDGKPYLHRDGYSRVTWSYDHHGNLKEIAYFGTDETPCLHRDGYARIRCHYGPSGHKELQTYFGLNDTPCLHKDGYARIAWRYNERGNIEKVAYFGADFKPVANADGIAHETWSYNDQGQVIKHSVYDAAGNELPGS